MIINLKYYNSTLRIGFNFPKEVYDCNEERWIQSKVHVGRLVYGKNRIPYRRIADGIDKRNYKFEAKEFLLDIVVKFFVNVSQNEWKYLQKTLRIVKNSVSLQKIRLFTNR